MTTLRSSRPTHGRRGVALTAPTAVLALLVGGVAASRPATDGPWYDVTEIHDSIYGHKKELDLSAESALRMFAKEFPHLQERWRDELRQPIQLRSDAGAPPPQGIVELQEDRRTPHAVVIGFSPREVAVMVLRPTGHWLWHHFSECLAAFRIQRGPEVDALFGVGELERRYATRYKGVGYGDSAEAVQAALGEPDAIEDYQAVNYFRFSYFKDDLVIQFEHARVKTIVRGVPGALKEEVQQKGRRITRY